MPRSPSQKLTLTLSEVQFSINQRLADFAETQINKAANIHEAYAELWQAIEKQFKGGGKRLRPYLLALAFQSFGGVDQSSMLEVATSWELLHISMTIHDDIIDRDYKRHGHDNIAGLYINHYAHIKDPIKKKHYANSAALLAGDLLLASAYDLVNNSAFDDEKRKRTLGVLQEAIFVVIGGEFLDSEGATKSSLVDPLIIAEAKTASYSIIGPLISGAVLAGADKQTEQKLRELGRILGVGYQMVDDYIGIFGNPELTGKSIDSDLVEGKMSIVIVMSLGLMSKSDRQNATKWLVESGPEHVFELRKLIEATDVRKHVKTELNRYKKESLEIIEQLKLSQADKQAFEAVVDILLERNS